MAVEAQQTINHGTGLHGVWPEFPGDVASEGRDPGSLWGTRFRLTPAVAELLESRAGQGQAILRTLDAHGEQLARIEAHMGTLAKEVHGLASEQAVVGNRVANAFSRALRANIRLDDIEDAQTPG